MTEIPEPIFGDFLPEGWKVNHHYDEYTSRGRGCSLIFRGVPVAVENDVRSRHPTRVLTNDPEAVERVRLVLREAKEKRDRAWRLECEARHAKDAAMYAKQSAEVARILLDDAGNGEAT